MKKFELIIGLIAFFAITLKLFHIPFSGVLTVLSLGILLMFYFGFSFAIFNNISLQQAVAFKSATSKRLMGAIGLGFALSILIVGVLYKLQFWPFANFFLTIGLVASGLILVASVIFYFRSKAHFYVRVFKRIAIYGTLGLILLLTPASTLVDIYYGDNPEYAAMYKKVMANPDDLELRKQLDEMEEEMWRKELEEERGKNK